MCQCARLVSLCVCVCIYQVCASVCESQACASSVSVRAFSVWVVFVSHRVRMCELCACVYSITLSHRMHVCVRVFAATCLLRGNNIEKDIVLVTSYRVRSVIHLQYIQSYTQNSQTTNDSSTPKLPERECERASEPNQINNNKSSSSYISKLSAQIKYIQQQRHQQTEKYATNHKPNSFCIQ